MRLIESLKGAKQLIEKPEHWIQKKAVKLDSDGNKVGYCLAAALNEFNSEKMHDFHGVLLPILRKTTWYNGNILAQFNDHYSTTHADVIRLLDNSIEYLYLIDLKELAIGIELMWG